ncbi:MAG: anti-sigma factor domain-containing protein [Phycisphaerales bacterium JB039]
MSERHPVIDYELLAAAAMGDASEQEWSDVEALLRDDARAQSEFEALELAAAALAVATAPAREQLPRSVRQQTLRAIEQAEAAERRGANPQLRLTGEGRRAGVPAPVAYFGWLAAAACLVLAVAVWMVSGPGSAGGAESLAEQRQDLLAEAPDAVRLEWGDWALEGAPPEIDGVRGDVVWSESRQEGYLRFVGLPPNDPTHEQYQLWIIDRRGLADEDGQSARISGAIFNAAGDEVIVPIEPAIPVQGAAAFAVTIEAPGGVWASDMSRRVVIAAKG